ncbi:imidazole glycerol phosphate synthase cyclase subunit [Paraneptunicella aestuarii]|uniref:imidazole glycerol phosphate synthase subunit HisF n=1 Tax=Paraneptunicella aestuarii TaxID=2831148 RepID=UPI001E28C34F|nr:imidazole glycerol phosphate synthase cyclase subunit [Paraneptunicella aestuarii]UAA39140.1 imidazole glycerol phosphate synthase cyclase subunit [Paraneptunicella aestuarii]
MRNIRVIARLDVKGPNLIKGIHLEGLRVVGDPHAFSNDYFNQGIDEIIYMDAVASLYGRNSLTEIVESMSRNIFIPITVGGGIRSVDDAWALFRSGADKVALNTAAIANPELITLISQRFGNQAVVVSIEAKAKPGGKWEAYVDNGREKTGVDVVTWAKEVERLGAGEILLTSVDKEGTQRGFDLPLIKSVSNEVNIPVIASGGMGSLQDFKACVLDANADAVAIAHMLHYKKLSVSDIKAFALSNGIPVRP